jgi:hypothetical protein
MRQRIPADRIQPVTVTVTVTSDVFPSFVIGDVVHMILSLRVGFEAPVYPHVLGRVLTNGVFDLCINTSSIRFIIASREGSNNREELKLIS